MENVILVTGSTGLAGRGLAKALESNKKDGERWVLLSSKDGDLRDFDQCKSIFEKYQPTHCLHLAAFVGGLFRNLKYKTEFFNYNMSMNMNVLLCCHQFQVKKVVSCLSTCIFPDRANYPINETMLHDGPPHESNEGYAYAKRMVDVMNRCYSSQYGSVFTSVIPTNIYGPYDNFHLENGHVIPALIHKCYLANKNNNHFVVSGSGAPLTQFIYNEDLGRLLIWAVRSYNDTTPIILSVDPEDEVSIKTVSELIAKEMQFHGPLVFDKSKADGSQRKTADNQKLREAIPNYKFVPISDGIRTTIEWFIKNYEIARK
jgi:GDP-L-fucose synthase